MARPVDMLFIVGPPRSGTTLILNMLVMNQPEVGGARKESQFYANLNKKPYDLKLYLKSPYFKFLFSKEEIEELFQEASSPLEFFKLAISRHREKTGISIFVEKSPIHTLYFEEILADFPNAKFILILRNPCANIESLAFTEWITLLSDRLPGPFRKIKILRYLSAMISYEHFIIESRKVASSESCIMTVQYEDVVMDKIDLKKELEEGLGIELAPMYISRPFSDAVEHREYKLDRSRIDGYKRTMPLGIQKLIRITFAPQTGIGSLISLCFRWLFLRPMVWLKKTASKI